MERIELHDMRKSILRWLQPIFIVVLLCALTSIFFVTPPQSYTRTAYTTLIVSLLITTSIAYLFTLKEKYSISSYIMVIFTFLGVWATVFINNHVEVNDAISIVYITIPILFSSLLLSPLFTVILAIVQFFIAFLTVWLLPLMLPFDKANLLAYILIASVLSIVSNYIINVQFNRYKEGAVKDHLTKLFNRRYFEETLNTLIHRGASQKVNFGIILADVDNFKSYNDRFGHAIGDHILTLAANFFSNKVGVYDVVCRYGGDEFAIIIPHTTEKKLVSIAKMINSEIKGVDCSKGEVQFPHITISMGLALFPIHGLTSQGLMMHADKQLFKAKESGKDRIGFQQDMMSE